MYNFPNYNFPNVYFPILGSAVVDILNFNYQKLKDWEKATLIKGIWENEIRE